MKSRKIIFIIGLVLFFMPAFGFPSSWENALLVLFGAVLCGITISSFAKDRKDKSAVKTNAPKDNIFVQNGFVNIEDKEEHGS
ncbi:MAG: hypothetical protein A2653_03295 [Candidatus Zambryskibacteria bacterium RIFCSPHIGHO2_01_FULL_43_25]|uniref:Uncharacterized protein n=1 Tax=Candidatus Zambryskibacteria bacterium RIFCSPLOWO2_01_FULL_45_21 TaxID=1802761 RepID=A0A1G2U1L7_9BACT|nr:MAG: hypothetical protein A2653_03295 [Candidatus Zambryskibacteria bacterium RIFCSPHIGHO2_01_FULL_43_25]OHB00161.1 MAG: hypothetical protein A3E94_01085 [Candidatus Zambryskibacteria bacterium RIFCSPHIGHO2_12_FULL_44_12b]OHB03426.1 MAG: hypothetical protein A3B14_02765 [Candidatus Zambryskibacteria bacterium RIFCSPLOWO2_01_FULL_45_21]